MLDFHLIATFAVILLTVVAYATERLPMEGVSLGSLAALLVLFGAFPYQGADGAAVSVNRLLAGFGDPALATIVALLVVGQALFATDAMDAPARSVAHLGRVTGGQATLLVLATAGIVSAFLNNTPVVVIFIPILAVVAAQRGYPAYRVFMPLSFICILGGMTTLIGSSTNLIAAGVAKTFGIDIGFFDITGMGLALALVGSVYVVFVMPRLMKERESLVKRESRMDGAQFIGEITLARGHPFVGLASASGLFSGLGDLTPRLVQRRDVPILPPFEGITLSPGDTLVVTGTRRAFLRALARGKAGVDADETGSDPATGEAADSAPPPGPDYHLVEAVISPASRFAGRTIQLSGIRAQFGLSVLGVQRKSRMARRALSEIRLEPGDTLLLGGAMQQIETLRGNHDLLLLEHSVEAVPQTRKAKIAVAIFLAIVLLTAFDVVPIVVAAIAGAVLMIATRCLTVYQAARAFDRQIFLLIGSSVALATALQATGGASLIAEGTVRALSGSPPAIVLSVLFLVMAIVTNLLSNNATAILFMPIAIGVAGRLGASPEAFVAAVIFAANCSFATPIGYQTNLLIMGPGHYRFSDFVRAGTPLVVIIWLTFSLLAPWYYSL